MEPRKELLTAYFVDSAGAPFDPNRVSLVIYGDMHEEIASYTEADMNHPETGRYVYEYLVPARQELPEFLFTGMIY